MGLILYVPTLSIQRFFSVVEMIPERGLKNIQTRAFSSRYEELPVTHFLHHGNAGLTVAQ